MYEIFNCIVLAHPGFILLLAIVIIWDLVWKVTGAWRAGRNNQFAWFLVILIFNTVGILPLVYLIWFAKNKNSRRVEEKRKRR